MKTFYQFKDKTTITEIILDRNPRFDKQLPKLFWLHTNNGWCDNKKNIKGWKWLLGSSTEFQKRWILKRKLTKAEVFAMIL